MLPAMTGLTLLRWISCIYSDRVPAIVSITKMRPLPFFRSVSDRPVKAWASASAATLDFRGTKPGRQKASRSRVPKTLMANRSPVRLREEANTIPSASGTINKSGHTCSQVILYSLASSHLARLLCRSSRQLGHGGCSRPEPRPS